MRQRPTDIRFRGKSRHRCVGSARVEKEAEIARIKLLTRRRRSTALVRLNANIVICARTVVPSRFGCVLTALHASEVADMQNGGVRPGRNEMNQHQPVEHDSTYVLLAKLCGFH